MPPWRSPTACCRSSGRGPVTSISEAAFDQLLATFEREAIHLETRDAYGTAVELPHMAKWAAGEPDALAWLGGWCPTLRELRRDAGLTGRALAAALGWHFTRVSKLEHGVQAPTDADIRDWCRACRADDHVPDLLATLRTVESAYLEFRRQARAGMKRVLGAHTVALYDRTTLFRIYEHNVIPGLFQTADYSAAMLAFWIQFLETPNDLDAAVAARMERQRVLYRRDKRFVVVLEEQALRTWFGTAEKIGRAHV